MLTRLISGDHLRKTRLHDEKGNFVGWTRICTNGSRALATGALRLAFKYRPALPWIPYSVIAELRKYLTGKSRILEYGSGMSTVWYARNAGEVCSVEDFRPWHDKVERLLHKKGITNVHYRFASEESQYVEFCADDLQGFDLIVVDGSHRSRCLATACRLLKSRGILYLDNSDKDSAPNGGDMRIAEQLAIEFARSRGASAHFVTDFAPGQFFVQQGLLIRLSN